MKNKIRKLVVFPTDPLIAYVKKGEVKERYFNPKSYFDEVHVIDISPQQLSPEQEKQIANLAGKGRLVVHFFKCASKFQAIFMKKRILESVRTINPDCIRAYGVFAEGYLASHCSKKLGIPLVISIHTDYHWYKYYVMFRESFISGILQYAFMLLFLKKIAKQASELIYVYNTAMNSTRHLKIPPQRQHVIYNKVFFKPAKKSKGSSRFTLIYVGNFISFKNQGFLLDVIEPLDVSLILVGKGPLRARMMERAQNNPHLKNKVTFIESLPNRQLPASYAKADAFISAATVPGIAIPAIEAMACGLPVIHRKPFKGEYEPPFFDAMLFSDPDKEAFRQAIRQFQNRPELLREYAAKSRKAFSQASGEKMEAKETEVYKKII
jgi:1,2-diacylglycerol 3-alpha-glucosyltransferase